jgi:hypothetical protein
VDAVLNGEPCRIQDLTKPFTGKDGGKGKQTLLIGAMSDALSTDLNDPARRDLWERLREVARWKNPTVTEVVAALVGGF